MSSFRLGAIVLASSWEPLLHPSILQLSFPPVPAIDCQNCWMAASGVFHPRAKCCTQVPTMANFLVGEILHHGYSPGGDETIDDWLEEGRGGPLQMHVPPQINARYQQHYENPLEQPGCPFLNQQGGCTVYEHRPPLCISYHCLFPQNPYMIGFWNSLGSLLELHTAITSQYLVKQLGIDIDQFKQFWQTHPYDSLWEGNGMTPHHQQELWQGRDKAGVVAYYKSCYDYILEHKDDIRRELVAYRRQQLLAQFEEEGVLTAERAAEIEQQPEAPSAQEPPKEIYQAFMSNHIVRYAEHRWTLTEHESYVLWFHQKAWGEQAPAL